MQQNERAPISIIGSSRCTRRTAVFARAVAALLTEAGVPIVCSGRGHLTREIVQGARGRPGSVVVGITYFDSAAILEPLESGLDVVIDGGTPANCGCLQIMSARAVIAFGGSSGTLFELSLALKLGKRVVVTSSWMDLDIPGVTPPPCAKTPQEAVEELLYGSCQTSLLA